MKYTRQKAILLTAALCIGLLSGCGTSQLSQEESTDSEFGSWVDLTLPSPSQTMPSLPETTQETTEETADQDVTKTYQNIFLGLWDNADQTKTYEFLSNENLIVTQGTASTNYTYWVLDIDGQVELNIFENGAQEAERYSFSKSGNNLTLYDVVSGNAVESLTRRAEETEETEEPATAAPTAAATATPTTTPTATAAPVTSTEPTAEPTVAPTTAPVVEEVPVVVPEEIQLPQSIYNSLSAVECVLDVVLDGTAFNGENSDSFWNTLARYLSRSMGSDEDGTFTVTTAQVSSGAREIFSGLASVPDCPQNSDIAVLETAEDGTECYRLHWGATGGHDLEVTANDGVDTIEVTADGSTVYAVCLDSTGAVISVTAA
jgi:hypothetical protein